MAASLAFTHPRAWLCPCLCSLRTPMTPPDPERLKRPSRRLMRIGMPSFKPHPAREGFTEGVSGCRQSGVRGHPVGLTALVVTGHLRADPRLPVSYGTRDAEDAQRATSPSPSAPIGALPAQSLAGLDDRARRYDGSEDVNSG